jgi:purine catabolism regulator
MAPSRPNLTVRELVENRALGLKVLAAGDLDAVVRGAHAIEIEHPGAWLEPDWAMLTTGMRFSGLADAGPAYQALVAELAERRVAALLFGVGVHFDTAPQGLIQACREHGLSLIAIAADVPFLAIERAVNHAVMSSEASQLKQSLQLQNDLIAALAEDQPVRALVSRMGTLLKGTAILYEESGTIVASTGDGPAMLVWGEIQAAGTRQASFVVGRWHFIARPTVLRGIGYWLALGSKREDVLDELAEPLLDVTERLLGAIRGVRTLSAAQSMAESAQILRALRADISPETASRLWDRLRGFRFQRDRELRAFVTQPVARTGAKPQYGLGDTEPEDEALSLAHELGVPLLLEAEDGILSGLVGDHPGLTGWSQHLAKEFHVGLSEPFTDLHLTKTRFRDAGRALRVATRRAAYRVGRSARDAESETPRGGRVLMFEDADVINWLLSSRNTEAVSAKLDQQLGHLLARPDLVETLLAYFAANMDANATAKALFLHTNSVRYRLRKIEELIQAPMSSPAVIANLYVALHDQVDEGDTGYSPLP